MPDQIYIFRIVWENNGYNFFNVFLWKSSNLFFYVSCCHKLLLFTFYFVCFVLFVIHIRNSLEIWYTFKIPRYTMKLASISRPLKILMLVTQNWFVLNRLTPNCKFDFRLSRFALQLSTTFPWSRRRMTNWP